MMQGEPPGSLKALFLDRVQNHDSKRWNIIFDNHKSTTSLKHDTAQWESSPCDSGLRSICWRIFLLYPVIDPQSWLKTLQSERNSYSELHKYHLKNFFGESAFETTDVDPLAEDESNPYELYRRDEELRQEIFQDIERCMPDNMFFRNPKVQNSLLEILFIYCKLNQDVSYRQGFHELAAVIYWVVACDALSPEAVAERTSKITEDESIMREVLDPGYIDHDTFSLFQCIMRSAKAWYELGEDNGNNRRGDAMGNSPIVQKSKYIHETLLMATDPELSEHLKALDVLPQVFLIRWIRLLFGREFPFDELLYVWDLVFAEDPDLHLVDLICVAMLLRIRWKLIEADYSTALTLLLRYPSPRTPNPPVTLVKDAIYLRNNLEPRGAKYIITKYSKRPPATHQHRPPIQKPGHSGRALSPMKPLFQTSQIESIVQDVAKNVLDRSEKWGVNRAVREAVVEVKKNVQGYQQHQHKQLANTKEEELTKRNRELTTRLQSEEERRRQLARILDTSIDVLSSEEVGKGDKADALRRISHVKECLLDDARSLDKDLLQPSTASPFMSPTSKSRRSSISANNEQPIPQSPPIRKYPVSPPGTFVKTSFKSNSDPDFISLAQRPRATLAQSSFAWMLGDDPVSRTRRGFVASNKSSSGPRQRSMDSVQGKDVNNSMLLDSTDEGFDLGSFKKPEEGGS